MGRKVPSCELPSVFTFMSFPEPPRILKSEGNETCGFGHHHPPSEPDCNCASVGSRGCSEAHTDAELHRPAQVQFFALKGYSEAPFRSRVATAASENPPDVNEAQLWSGLEGSGSAQSSLTWVGGPALSHICRWKISG